MMDASYDAAENLAYSAEDGLDVANSETAGENFGAGFAQGIGSWLQGAADAAAGLARSALDALSGAIQEGSPSRLTRQSGRFFGQGL